MRHKVGNKAPQGPKLIRHKVKINVPQGQKKCAKRASPRCLQGPPASRLDFRRRFFRCAKGYLHDMHPIMEAKSDGKCQDSRRSPPTKHMAENINFRFAVIFTTSKKAFLARSVWNKSPFWCMKTKAERKIIISAICFVGDDGYR